MEEKPATGGVVQPESPKSVRQPDRPPTVIEEIQQERVRQMTVEGYTMAHDDSHDRQELVRAAACYALDTDRLVGISEQRWPWRVWPIDWAYRPKDRRRNLIIAAALIVAQIERDDRLAETVSG